MGTTEALKIKVEITIRRHTDGRTMIYAYGHAETGAGAPAGEPWHLGCWATAENTHGSVWRTAGYVAGEVVDSLDVQALIAPEKCDFRDVMAEAARASGSVVLHPWVSGDTDARQPKD